MDKLEVNWRNRNCPTLVFNDDVEVEIYRSTDDNEIIVQISTSSDSDSWEGLRVYLNDSQAKEWK